MLKQILERGGQCLLTFGIFGGRKRDAQVRNADRLALLKNMAGKCRGQALNLNLTHHRGGQTALDSHFVLASTIVDDANQARIHTHSQQNLLEQLLEGFCKIKRAGGGSSDGVEGAGFGQGSLGFSEEAGILDGAGGLAGDGREQVFVLFIECVRGIYALKRDDTEHLVAVADRNAQPGTNLVDVIANWNKGDAQLLAAADAFFAIQKQRLASANDVIRMAIPKRSGRLLHQLPPQIGERHTHNTRFRIVGGNKESGAFGGDQADGKVIDGFSNGILIQKAGEDAAQLIEQGELLATLAGLPEELGVFDGDTNLLTGKLHQGEPAAEARAWRETIGAERTQNLAFGFERDADKGVDAGFEQLGNRGASYLASGGRSSKVFDADGAASFKNLVGQGRGKALFAKALRQCRRQVALHCQVQAVIGLIVDADQASVGADCVQDPGKQFVEGLFNFEGASGCADDIIKGLGFG